MSKIDTVLEEIYLEMEMEEADELMEQTEYILQELDLGAIKDQIMRLMGLKRTLGDKIKGALGVGNTSVAEKLKNQMEKLNGQLADLKKQASSLASKGLEKGGEAIEKGKELAQGAGKSISKAAGQAGEFVSKKATAAGELVAANPGAAAGAAAVAAVAAGVILYKKFFSQAAKACKGKAGADKKKCVASFKVKGLQAAKAKVAAGMAKCKDAKCKAKLQSKVQGFDAKINAMKGKLSETVMNEYVGDYISELFLENLSKN